MICRALILLLLLTTTVAHAATVELSWDKNTEPDLAGYRVYYGNYSGNTSKFASVGSITVPATVNTATVTVASDKKWYFRVTAFNDQLESLYSNMVQVLFIRTPAALKFQRIDIR